MNTGFSALSTSTRRSTFRHRAWALFAAFVLLAGLFTYASTQAKPVLAASPGVADAATSMITADNNSPTVDNTVTITVQLNDDTPAALTVGGDAVTLLTTHGVLTSVTDNASGTYTATLTATTPGTATITGKVNSVAITDGETVVFAPGAVSAAHTTIDAAPPSINVDTGSSAITVTARDQYDNPTGVSGGTVTLASTNTGALTVVTDNANGTYSATLTDTVTHLDTVTGTIATLPITDLATVDFTPGALHHFVVSVSGTKTAGAAFPVTVTAYDQFNNLKTDAGTLCVAFSGPSSSPAPFSLGPIYPNQGGCLLNQSALLFDAFGSVTFNVTIKNAVSTTLTVTDVVTSKFGSSAAITVNPAGTASLAFADPGTTVPFNGQPVDTKVSTPIYSVCAPSVTLPCSVSPPSTGVLVLVRDAFGNRVADNTSVGIGVSPASTGLATARLTVNGVVDFGDALTITSTNTNVSLKAATTVAPVVSPQSNTFQIALDVKGCTGQLCVNTFINNSQIRIYNQIATSSAFNTESINTLLRTQLVPSAAFGTTNACGTNPTILGSGSEAAPRSSSLATTLPTTTMLIVVPKAVLKSNTARSARSFNVCIGATWIGTGGASPWTAITSNGVPTPAKLDGGVYWGIAGMCPAGPVTSNPCVAVKSKQAIDVQNYFGWTSAYTAQFMKDSDLAVIIRKSSPWDGKGGVY